MVVFLEACLLGSERRVARCLWVPSVSEVPASQRFIYGSTAYRIWHAWV